MDASPFNEAKVDEIAARISDGSATKDDVVYFLKATGHMLAELRDTMRAEAQHA